MKKLLRLSLAVWIAIGTTAAAAAGFGMFFPQYGIAQLASFFIAPGLTNTPGTCNTSTQTVVGGNTISGQNCVTYETASYPFASNDSGTFAANGTGAITFTLLAPTTPGYVTPLMQDATEHGFTVTTASGVLNGFIGSGTNSYTFPAGTAVQCEADSTGGAYLCSVWWPSGGSTILPWYLAGGTLSNDATSPNTVLDIAQTQATSDDGAVSIVLPATTKTLGSFTAGSGNGCLDTGTVAAGTWYWVEAISKSGGSAPDVLCTISPTAPTYPSGYTEKRALGAIFTCDVVECASSSTNIAKFVQRGTRVYFSNTQLNSAPDIYTTTLGTSSALFTLPHVPPNAIVKPLCRYTIASSASATVTLTSPDEPDLAVTATNNFGATSFPGFDELNIVDGAGSYLTNTACPPLTTNAIQQVRARASNSSTSLAVIASGWDY